MSKNDVVEVKLKDVFELQMGKTPARSNSHYWDGNNKWISIADIGKAKKFIFETRECISDLAIKESGIKIVPKGTVIMSFKLSIGKTAITAEDIYTNEAIMAFIDNGKYEIDAGYLYHYCNGTDWTAGSNKAVMGMTLNKATLSEKRIKIPNLKKQKTIAYELDKVDDLIRIKEEQNDELEQLIKSRFVEMFGDPETNVQGWEEESLSKHLTIIGGYAFKSDSFKEKGIPVLRIGNINSGHFTATNMVFWNDDESLERYAIYPGDMVMSLTGTVGKDDYGNLCILGNDYGKYYLNQRNAKLELDEEIEKYYFAQLLKFTSIKRRLTGISRGVRQANISNKDVLNLVIPVPPIELQQQFADFVEQVEKAKQVIKEQLEELEILKNSLMQKYFG